MSSTDETMVRPMERKAPRPFDEEAEYADAEENFKPKTLKFWLIILGMYASIFLVALDRMIIAPAIPTITDQFHSIQDIGWYGSAYMLTCAIFNPLFGRIYQLYSTKWVFIASIVVFEVGSTVSGAAPSSTPFIIGRAIAGIGAAGIFCGGIMITVPLVPLRRRPLFTAIFGLAFGVSSVLGPLVGGAFTDNSNLTWRWCFYINLPIGGFTILAMLLFLHLDSPPREKLTLLGQIKQYDPIGLFFFVPSMVSLILALQWGGTTYDWSDAKIIGLLVCFSVTFILFLVVEALTPATALAPARVVLNRSVAGSMIFMFLLSGGMMAVAYYLAIWFQAAQGQSAADAGIRTIPLVLSFIIFSIFVAGATEASGYYVPGMLLCPILCAVGGGMLSTITPDAGANHWLGYQVIYGIGMGCGFQTSNFVPQNVLPRADVPLGMALMFFMQQLGGSIMVPVAQNVFTNKLVDRLSTIEGLDIKSIVDAGATAFRNLVPENKQSVVIDAFSYSLTRVFVLAAAISACTLIGALLVEWKSIKKPAKTDASEEVAIEAGEAKREVDG